MKIQIRIVYFAAVFIVALIFFGKQSAFAQLLKLPDNGEVEAKVSALFADAPNMIAIAKCESGFRQYDKVGMPLRGGNGFYIGVFQISEIIHADRAKALGFDIYETDGNLGYAKYLYAQRGAAPWVSCLANPAAASTNFSFVAAPAPVAVPVLVATSTDASAPTIPTSTIPTLAPTSAQTATATPVLLTSNLQMGMLGPQVTTLQQLLNAAGFTVAASGPGSPGNETMQFGKLTREAVMRFQCSRNIICSGNESTTGYGRLGPKTRIMLLQIARPVGP